MVTAQSVDEWTANIWKASGTGANLGFLASEKFLEYLYGYYRRRWVKSRTWSCTSLKNPSYSAGASHLYTGYVGPLYRDCR